MYVGFGQKDYTKKMNEVLMQLSYSPTIIIRHILFYIKNFKVFVFML